MPIVVPNDGIPAHARRLASEPVQRADLALAFS